MPKLFRFIIKSVPVQAKKIWNP